MGEPRDNWSKAEIFFGAMVGIGGVAVPLVLALFGARISASQDETARVIRHSERLTSLIDPLSSDNPRKRSLASEVAGYLAQHGELPPELIPVLRNLTTDDPNAATAKAASEALARAEQRDPQLKTQVEESFRTIPARVYFHISKDEQRSDARSLAAQLIDKLGSDFVVPGIERKPGPKKSELRFFRSSERADAERVQQTLRQLGVNVELVDLSSRYETSTRIRPRHLELWLNDQYGSQPEA